MTLFEFATVNNWDFDVDFYDYVYDAETCISVMPEMEKDEEDEYAKMMRAAFKCFSIVHHARCLNISEVVEAHPKFFHEFMDKHWINKYDDEDEFRYQWVMEIFNYMTGNATPSQSKLLREELLEPLYKVLQPEQFQDFLKEEMTKITDKYLQFVKDNPKYVAHDEEGNPKEWLYCSILRSDEDNTISVSATTAGSDNNNYRKIDVWYNLKK